MRGFVALQPEDVLISGYDRYQRFMERLGPRYGEVDEGALMEMVKRPVSMGSNLHVAIFHPESLEVWVAVAGRDGAPAGEQPYARYVLGGEGSAEAAPAAEPGAAPPK